MTSAWFSPSMLAELKLPGLSGVKRKINERAIKDKWALQVGADGQPLSRIRAGRGGGVEYHVSVLPVAARMELVKRGLAAPEGRAASNVTAIASTPSAQLWDWFERLSAPVKAEAETRVAMLAEIEQLNAQGLSRTAAVATVAAKSGVACSTIYNWLKLVAGCNVHDRLPHLAPRRVGGGAEAVIDADLWRIYCSNYLRFEKPTHAASYEIVRRIAVDLGQSIPHALTFRRKFERETDPALIVATREGRDAVARLIPPQQRSVEHMHAMQMVNIDGHRWDVFVRFPDGTIARPLMVAIQDIYSRKMLSWRIDINETAFITRLAFADLFRDFGLPKWCLLDNGRAFASKWITGGAKTRFRFKINDDDPRGLLPALGIENKWATPYHGQAKPIERAFRNMCDHIAKCPDFAGAYTGNNTMAKPENYGNTAIPLDVFERVIAREIAAHNARPGRQTEMAHAHGESFDDVFERSFQQAGICMATHAQMRFALTAGEQRRAHREDGSVTIYGNKYWSPGMAAHAGKLLTVRFDPENLHSEVHVYETAGGVGGFIASVPILEASGFDNADAAQKRGKLVSDHRKAVRRKVELANLLKASDIAEMMPEPVAPDRHRPNIIRPARVRGSAAVQIEAASTFSMDDFANKVAHLRVVPND